MECFYQQLINLLEKLKRFLSMKQSEFHRLKPTLQGFKPKQRRLKQEYQQLKQVLHQFKLTLRGFKREYQCLKLTQL